MPSLFPWTSHSFGFSADAVVFNDPPRTPINWPEIPKPGPPVEGVPHIPTGAPSVIYAPPGATNLPPPSPGFQWCRPFINPGDPRWRQNSSGQWFHPEIPNRTFGTKLCLRSHYLTLQYTCPAPSCDPSGIAFPDPPVDPRSELPPKTPVEPINPALPRPEPRRGAIAITRSGGLFPNTPGTTMCDAQGNSYHWPGPGRNIVEVTGVDGSRTRWDVGVVPRKLLRSWRAGSFAATTCPTYTGPGIIGRGISSIRGGASRISSTAGRCRRWVTGSPILRNATYTVIGGVIYECIARELPSSEECGDQRDFYINGFHDLYECFKGLLDQFLAIRLKMLSVRNFCPVTPACRRRLDDAMARLNSAAETVRGWMEEANNARNAVFNIQCDIFDPTLIMGSIQALALQAAEQRHERLTELCDEGARTLAGWEAEAAKLSKECGCPAAGPIAVEGERRRGDDKFWRGEDMPRIDWK